MRHIKEYNQLFENQQELTQEQKDWLDECTSGTWKVNPKTGLVDVRGSFDCSRQGLSDFKGVRFGRVTGFFKFSFNKLTSLKGAPQSVGGSFNCSYNEIESLEGSPQSVGGDFNFFNNELKSLEGAPQSVGGSFDCSYNEIESLEGAPKKIGGTLYYAGNPVSDTTLEALYMDVESGMSWEEAVEMQWDGMNDDDRAILAQYNSRLSQEEIRAYQALARLKKRVI